MMRFECRVRSRQNPQDVEVMTFDAIDKDAAISKLHQTGHLVISVRELPDSATLSQVLAAGSGKFKSFNARKTLPFLFSVTTRELIFFAVQLSTLLNAGVALLRALEILQRGTANIVFADAIKKMTRTVSEGKSLGVAVREHPKIFPWLWVHLIEVGELSGTLPEVLREVSRYQESSEKIKGKVISAFFYPGILMTVAGGAVSFLLIVIVPKFQEIFASQNMTLPVLTQLIINVSNILKNYTLLVVIAVVALIYLIRLYAISPLGRVAMARFVLKIPAVGGLLLEVAAVRFSRSLATLLHAGLPLLKGLETAAKLTSNAYLEKNVLQVRESVSQGHGFGIQLESKRVFPVFMTQLISVGEETGEIESFLKMLSAYYEERVDQYLSRLSVIIEPVMLVIMAGIIGVIVVGMFLPIIELSTGGH